MFSRPLAFLLLALGCVTAAAGGAYLATRHNATEAVATTAAAPASGAVPSPAVTSPAQPSSQPVAETETAVSGTNSEAPPAPKAPHTPAAPSSSEPQPAPMLTPSEATPVPSGSSKPAGESARPVEAQPEPPRVPQFEEVIVPAGSVIGLQLETALSSDRARLEDRVEARVSRDVMAAGRVAIPLGARVMGTVIHLPKRAKVNSPPRIRIPFPPP